MPGFDRTGPLGTGPIGRGLGPCGGGGVFGRGFEAWLWTRFLWLALDQLAKPYTGRGDRLAGTGKEMAGIPTGNHQPTS